MRTEIKGAPFNVYSEATPAAPFEWRCGLKTKTESTFEKKQCRNNRNCQLKSPTRTATTADSGGLLWTTWSMSILNGDTLFEKKQSQTVEMTFTRVVIGYAAPRKSGPNEVRR